MNRQAVYTLEAINAETGGRVTVSLCEGLSDLDALERGFSVACVMPDFDVELYRDGCPISMDVH